jgi:hypothetical protein
MPDKTSFDEPLRRAFEANLRYYEALGQVTQDYVKALFGIVKEIPAIVKEIPIRLPALKLTPSATTPPAAAPPANPSTPASAATLVLEAEAGGEAQGVFMVENKLNRTVSTTVLTSAFADPSGRATTPTLRVVPNVVTLEPGGRTLVQIFANVSDTLEADVPYRAEVSVPGLSDHGIPLVLRRRPSSAAPAKAAASAAATRVTAATRGASARRARTASGESAESTAPAKRKRRRKTARRGGTKG